MAPTKSKKISADPKAKVKAGTKVPLRSSPSTPQHSPIKRRKVGITLQQKQTLIQNLQLEVTERARRLRAQYHAHAQGIRSRIEMRINRIPTSLRKMTMGELLLSHAQKELQKAASEVRPPVPAKDYPTRTNPKKASQAIRQKRLSHEISADKENENEHGENLKKRPRGAQMGSVRPGQVLSPTSSNSRIARHEQSPTKYTSSRPGSPLKGASRSVTATSVLSSMVEKAKAARAASSRKLAASTAPSRPATAMSARKPTTASRAQAARPPTRTRRLSNASDSSDASTTTVVRKATGTKATASSARKATASSSRKPMTSSKATGTLQTSSSGRILRKRA